ncbi:thymidylate kinase [Jidongwangia harbinensis]|uniref:thymidylate kinase n=1 Tax=Jidongwangia harbinensis TaxID=2878561 RepID=UPI001CD963ED|nr:thymidylate kinase [Jidongwangia harbinensis]MCA2213964.1 thymidylate kinase [Jidongwangia harbinensis]
MPARSVLPAAVAAALDAGGAPWAWQGPAGAPERWAADSGPQDLDIWYAAPSPDEPVAALAREFACARVAEAHDPRRLCHVSLAVETTTGAAVVDLTYRDLRVGPVLLVPATEIRADPATHRLTGAAAVADLLVRPVLRGRLPGPGRLAEARAAWTQAAPGDRQTLARRLAAELGAGVAGDLIAVAAGAPPAAGLPRRARLRLAVRSLAPGVVAATWAQRRTVLPAGSAAGPLGLRMRGVVVALVGTDGSGKSTVADGLHRRLHRLGLPTSPTYFGMARGNLPGVAAARRLLGAGSTAPGPAPGLAPGPAPGQPPGSAEPSGPAQPSPPDPSAEAPAEAPAARPPAARTPDARTAEARTAEARTAEARTAEARTAEARTPEAWTGEAWTADAPARPADRPLLRRAAAWVYAAEYLWRYLRTVAPAVARRRVVIADRWVYDLRESPWPGSRAARVAERLVPAPDLLVLPDAPADVIHRRKPERTPAEQARQQETFRRLLAERPARLAELVVDTSGARPDPLADLVAAVLQAAHGPRRRRR